MFCRKSLEEAKKIKMMVKENISDPYMVGLHNGIETVIALFENREPELEMNIYSDLVNIKTENARKQEKGRTLMSGIKRVSKKE